MNELISRLLGYLACTMSALFYSGGVATAQLMGRIFPRFELNLFRMLSQMLMCALIALVVRQNVLTIRNYWHMTLVFVCASLYTWTVLSLNLAPLYAPVGNLESVAMAVYVWLNVSVAVLERKASVTMIIGAVVSCVGVTLLTQPDFLFDAGPTDDSFVKDPCPCVGMARYGVTSRPSQCGGADGRHRNVSFIQLEVNFTDGQQQHESFNESALSGYGSPLSPNSSGDTAREIWHLPGLSDEAFGYLLTASTGVCFFIVAQITQKILLLHYSHVTLTVWYGVIGTALSAILMLALEVPVLVQNSACVWITVVHGTFASSSLLLNVYSMRYITAEENAILMTLTVVVLFIAQATVLTQFQPVRGNAYEYAGAVLVVLACLLDPVYKLLQTHRKVKEDNPQKTLVNSIHTAAATDEKTPLLSQK